jgi:glycosyltransferase involved in cell wall biosynthesis
MSKRILHLESSPGWGGQEIRILNEARGMRKRGYTIYFAVAKKGKLIARAKSFGFKVFEVNYRKIAWGFSFFYLIWIIKKYKIDIIVTHSSEDSWLGGIIAKLLKKPVVRTRHLSTPVKKGLNSLLLYNFLTTYVVTTCQISAKTLAKQSKKKKSFFHSIPTGIDVKSIEIDEKEKRKWRNKIGKNSFIVGTLCFIRSWKGIEDFLKAANFLREFSSIKWVVIGGGHSKKYKKLAKELNLEEIVTFTGHLENPYSAISSLDVFLLLSTAHEGVSQATLQAAYLEKPIIGTDVGGIPEVCIHKKTGFLVPTFNYRKVADAVLKLKGNRKLIEKMGKKGKELVLEKFTYEKMLDKMEDIFIKALE